MRNDKNHSGRCTKQTFSKHPGICRTYSPIQLAYAEQLEADPSVKEFQCKPVTLEELQLLSMCEDDSPFPESDTNT